MCERIRLDVREAEHEATETEKKSALAALSLAPKLRSPKMHNASETTPMTVSVKKIERHPLASVCRPPKVGPIAGATLIAMPTVPMAMPRRSSGKIVNTEICSTGHMTPVPMASRRRPSSTSTKLVPTQASSEPSVKITMEAMTICLVEKRRVKNAVSGTITPIVSWKIEVSHWPVVTVMLNSSTIVGSAALSCSCVKLPTKVMKVRTASEMNAGLVKWPLR